eukprot:superscaffoldBa00006950_g22067
MSAENNHREAMLLEIQQLRRELQRASAMKAPELRDEEMSCPQIAEALSQELEEAEKNQSAESLMLAAELTEAKHELEDLQQQLHTEKVSRRRAETEKLEAVDIAEALFHKVDETQRLSEELSAESCVLSARLRSEEAKQAELRHEILELQRTLHKEKQLRAEAEKSNLEAVRAAEALFQKLEEARTVAEKLSAESQTLADKLKTEKEKQEALNQDIMELIQKLDKETLLRIRAENYEMEAVEVLEVLQQRSDGRRTRTSCSNRRNFSRRFTTRATRRAAH